MPAAPILINRAPVLTLWAALVAERLGHSRATALTLGKAVAGMNAQAKGQRLGVFEKPKREAKPAAARAKRAESVALLGREVPVVTTPRGVRAAIKDEPVSPESVERYLKQKFGNALEPVTDALRALAASRTPKALATEAYTLYEKFRPTIPPGVRGWGAKGELDLKAIARMAKGGG